MPSAFYDNHRNVLLGAGVHGAVDYDDAGTNIKIILYDEGADPLNLADQDIADILAGARIATSGNVATKTVGTAATGAFDHDNVTFSAVSGASVESMTYWKDTATEATSPLLFNLDEGSVTGLPVTPNGGDITWTPAAGGVMQLT